MSDTVPDPASNPETPELEPTRLKRIPLGLRIIVGIVGIIALSVLLALFRDAWWHWFEVHTGTVNETGPYYGFWSGFGSDLGEATLVVGVIGLWRHHNCHVKGCPRLGRPVPGTPYVACPRHHPMHTGNKRGISHELLHREYNAAKQGTNPPST